MKRSEINAHIRAALDLFSDIGFTLPPFAHWTPDQWRVTGHEADEIRDNGLGWDVTDFGRDDFNRLGLLLFTIRNGNCHRQETYPKRYAEKIMVVREGQVTPMHFHWNKREDIINRGGGRLVIRVYAADREQLGTRPLQVSLDGVRQEVDSGARLVLAPGESICLEPFVYHTFHGEQGYGPVVVGEVSDVNDDHADNRFLEPLGRFPEILEDEPPFRLLCTEYPPPREATP